MEITVVIPTYNRYILLKRALRSVFAQTYRVTEVIVVDDGSSDDTALISKDFPSITYLYQQNRGVSAARNLGVANANSPWIAFLDSDDEWLEEKLEKQVAFHKESEELCVSYTDEHWIRNGSCVKIPKKFHKKGESVFLENLSYCNIAPSSTLIERAFFQNMGGFDESLVVCEDYDLWLRILLKHKMGLLKEKLINKHAGEHEQLSFLYWGMDRFRVQTLEKILPIAPQEKREVIKEELIKKYMLLLKGAIKYDKITEIDVYKKRIDFYTTKADL